MSEQQQPSSSAPKRDHDAFERIAEEYLARKRRGESPTIEEYAERYPDQATEIQSLFPLMEMLETAPSEQDPAEHPAPLMLGEYKILREIGRGGMGVVYEARQQSLGRRVAIKLLPVQASLDQQFLARFEREAQAAASLQHPHIVPIHGVGEYEGLHYYVMQYIEGNRLDRVLGDIRHWRKRLEPLSATSNGNGRVDESIASHLHTRELSGNSNTPAKGASSTADSSPSGTELSPSAPSSVKQRVTLETSQEESGSAPVSLGSDHSSGDLYYRNVARITLQVAEALQHAHAQGILHRDVKPGNLLLSAEGHAWVTDFGLCTVEGSEDLTASDGFVGTVRYMAPERFSGNSDARSDVYGLGVTLYEMLTLRPAFEGADRARLIRNVTQQQPVRPRRVERAIPQDLETIALKATEKLPEARYASAAAFAADLRAFLERRPIQARRPSALYLFRLALRRNPAISLTGIAALLLIAVLTAVYISNIQEAIDSAKYSLEDARAFQLAADAAEALDWDPTLSVLLAQEAIRLRRNVHTISQLHHSMSQLRELPPFEGHTDIGHCVVFSPDGKELASTSRDGTVLIYDLEDSTTLPRSIEHPDVQGAQYSPDSNTLITISARELVVIPRAGKVLRIEHGPRLQMAKFSPDSKTFLLSDTSGVTRLWTTGGQEVRRYLVGDLRRPQGFAVKRVAFSPDGRMVATALGGADQGLQPPTEKCYVRLWDVDGTPRDELGGHHDHTVLSMEFSEDGRLLLTASLDCTARLWDLEDPDEEAVVLRHGDRVMGAEFHPDGEHVFTFSLDGRINLWNLDGELVLNDSNLSSVTDRNHGFSDDGSWLVLHSVDNKVHVLDPYGIQRFQLMGGSDDLVWSRASPLGRAFAAATVSGVVRRWEAWNRELPVLYGHRRQLFDAAYSRDGKRIVTTSMDHQVLLWTAEGDRLDPPLGRHKSWAGAVEFSHDGRLAITSSWDRTARIWDLQRELPAVILESEEQDPRGHAEHVYHASFSPDDAEVVTACADRRIRTWNARTGALRRRFDAQSPLGQAMSATYSHDGSEILTGWGDGTLLIFSREGELLRTLQPHLRAIHRVVSSAEGHILTASFDGTARLYKPDGSDVRFEGHRTCLFDADLSLSPRGDRIATASFDNTARLFDLDGNLIAELRGHEGAVTGVSFHPDGGSLVTSSNDGTARVWKVYVEDLLEVAARRLVRTLTPAELEKYALEKASSD